MYQNFAVMILCQGNVAGSFTQPLLERAALAPKVACPYAEIVGLMGPMGSRTPSAARKHTSLRSAGYFLLKLALRHVLIDADQVGVVDRAKSRPRPASPSRRQICNERGQRKGAQSEAASCPGRASPSFARSDQASAQGNSLPKVAARLRHAEIHKPGKEVVRTSYWSGSCGTEPAKVSQTGLS